MKITLTTPVTKETTLKLPVFYKDEVGNSTEYFAIIDENTGMKMYDFEKFTQVEKFNPADPFRKSQIVKAVSSYKPITEADFFDAFDRLYHDINLRPVLSNVVVEKLKV